MRKSKLYSHKKTRDTNQLMFTFQIIVNTKRRKKSALVGFERCNNFLL